jgi:CTP synthase
MRASGEVKTKPTQHSVATLRGIGIQPDILICRTEKFLDDHLKKKISLFCNVDQDAVITAIDVESTIYEVPLNFHHEGLDEKVVNLLNIWTRAPRLSPGKSWWPASRIPRRSDHRHRRQVRRSSGIL